MSSFERAMDPAADPERRSSNSRPSPKRLRKVLKKMKKKVKIEDQPRPEGRGADITPLVIADLKQRSELGKKRYGEKLKAFNGRNALVDAYQEALDLVQYLRQALEEQDAGVGLSANYMRRMYEKE